MKEQVEKGKKSYFYQVSDAPFYTIFNIGPYSFAPYRVVWSRMSDDVRAAVCPVPSPSEGKKGPVATDTTSVVSANSEAEAHFVCALLNSTPIRRFVKAFSSAGRGFAAPSILDHVALPKFNEENETHIRLAQLSMEAHRLALLGDTQNLAILEKTISDFVISLFV